MRANKKFKVFILILTAAALAAAVLLLWPGLLKAPTFKLNAIIKSANPTFAQVLFVGDVMLDRGIKYYADNNGGNNFVFKQIQKELLKYDLIVANLEGPITDNPSTSISTQPGEPDNYFFTFDPSWAKTLFNNNIKLVSLGNNHVLNFGEDGLISSKNYLDGSDIGYFGAPGYSKSVTLDIERVKIAFVNYNEFESLESEKNIKSTLDEIQKLKSLSDVIIVYCHWGEEYQTEPTEKQRQLAHKFIDAGADLIIGSHPHVVQTTEIYNKKHIYYSLGNFIFDQYFSEPTQEGLGVAIKINSNTHEIIFKELHFYMQPNGQTILVEK